MSLDVLRRISAATDGVFTVGAACRAGVSAERLAALCRQKVVLRVHRGVYALVGPTLGLTFDQRVRAACEATGGTASHWTAARLHGLTEAPAQPIHVTADRSSHRRAPAGVILHLTRFPLSEARPGALAATAPARTLVDLAGMGVPSTVLERFVAVLLSSRSTRLDSLIRAVDRSVGVPGVQAARAVLEEIAGPVDNVLEVQLGRLLRSWGLPPGVVQYHVRTSRTRCYRVDRAWPDRKVVLEVDGYRFHSTPEAFEADRCRHNELAAAGLTVLRTTWRQVESRSPTLKRQLEAALGPEHR
jgi:hypothetical protein